MKISDFDYNLPDEKIAVRPPEVRGNAKLLVVSKDNGDLESRKYSDLVDYFQFGDVLVLNDTKVIKARLEAIKSTGGKVELIILEKHGEEKFNRVLYKGHLKVGDELEIKNQANKVEMDSRLRGNDMSIKLKIVKILGNGIAEVESDVDLQDIADEVGSVPIPPYLNRESDDKDVERYQTVFAKNKGSVAAPTASLNFTEDLKDKLLQKGVQIVYLTLHVGLGTFLPVREDDVEKHDMHSEYFIIPEPTVKIIINAKKSGNKVFALGTTVTRTLEYASDKIFLTTEELNEAIPFPGGNQENHPYPSFQKEGSITGDANIFIYPGYEFKIVDALITNFHAPRSTVLLLANAFAGVENLHKAYDFALVHDYKFLSYGDSMLII